MKAKGRFISLLLVVDTFFVSYAFGFHSRHVLIVDPKLPPVVKKVEIKPTPPKVTAKTQNSKEHAKNLHDKKGHGPKTGSPARENLTKTVPKVIPKIAPKVTQKATPNPVKKAPPKPAQPKSPVVSDGKNES